MASVRQAVDAHSDKRPGNVSDLRLLYTHVLNPLKDGRDNLSSNFANDARRLDIG